MLLLGFLGSYKINAKNFSIALCLRNLYLKYTPRETLHLASTMWMRNSTKKKRKLKERRMEFPLMYITYIVFHQKLSKVSFQSRNKHILHYFLCPVLYTLYSPMYSWGRYIYPRQQKLTHNTGLQN